MLCVLVGAFAIPLSLFLVSGRKMELNVTEALHILDFRKKKKIFKIFLVLFFVMGLSFGSMSGFVFPLFLSDNGFDAKAIGLILGLQILVAGLLSYLFAGKFEIRKLILISGLLYTVIFILLGFSSSVFAEILVVVYGVAEGLRAIAVEGIFSRIINKESYGTDIGLLTMGLQGGCSSSLVISGLLISTLGFVAPFLMSALVCVLFHVTSYLIFKERASIYKQKT